MKYEDVIKEAFSLNHDKPLLVRMAPYIRRLAVVTLVMNQLGLMSLYIKLISTTIEQTVTRMAGITMPLPLMEFFVLVCLIPYSWVKNLKILSFFSMMGNVLVLICAGAFIQYACRHLQPVSSLPLVTKDLSELPLFFSGVVFSLEGIPMILPLENKVKRPEDFGGPCGLITLASAANISICTAMGFYGYLAFGDSVPGNALLALPDEWFYRVISNFNAVAVFLTFTLQLYQPAELVGSYVQSRLKVGCLRDHAQMLTRSALALMAYALATIVPTMELLMGLTGAFSTVVLVFVLPPLAEMLILRKERSGLPWYILFKDVALVIFGILVLITGIYVNLRDIIRAL